jgi:hypothetical protein
MVPLLTDVESVRRIAKTRARPAFQAMAQIFAYAGGMLGFKSNFKAAGFRLFEV